MVETMTCADVLRELRETGGVDICLPNGWISVFRDVESGDREIAVTDEVLRILPDEARLVASALLGLDVDALIERAEGVRDES